MEDIFTLAKIERDKKIERELCIKWQCERDRYKQRIAGFLYEATYKGYGGETFAHNEILDNFCDYLFGASFQEVIDAYDKYSG